MTDTEISITDMDTITIQEGDIVLVRPQNLLAASQAQAIGKSLHALGKRLGVDFVLFDESLDLSIVRKADLS